MFAPPKLTVVNVFSKLKQIATVSGHAVRFPQPTPLPQAGIDRAFPRGIRAFVLRKPTIGCQFVIIAWQLMIFKHRVIFIDCEKNIAYVSLLCRNKNGVFFDGLCLQETAYSASSVVDCIMFLNIKLCLEIFWGIPFYNIAKQNINLGTFCLSCNWHKI